MSVTIDILEGDCLELLKKFPDGFFDLIVTSPPYADRRRHTYGGIRPEEYIDWFLPRAREFFRVLKPTGSFVLNINLNPWSLNLNHFLWAIGHEFSVWQRG